MSLLGARVWKLFALRGTRRGGLEVEVLRGLEVQRLVISTDIVANKFEGHMDLFHFLPGAVLLD